MLPVSRFPSRTATCAQLEIVPPAPSRWPLTDSLLYEQLPAQAVEAVVALAVNGQTHRARELAMVFVATHHQLRHLRRPVTDVPRWYTPRSDAPEVT